LWIIGERLVAVHPAGRNLCKSLIKLVIEIAVVTLIEDGPGILVAGEVQLAGLPALSCSDYLGSHYDRPPCYCQIFDEPSTRNFIVRHNRILLYKSLVSKDQRFLLAF